MPLFLPMGDIEVVDVMARGLSMAQQPAAEDDLRSNDLYQDAKLVCDVVMKGGITSGVTYPWAICEMAREYRFRNVGGTSAGAIAAAAAAAAEVGRDSASGGFARLADLPDRISKQSPAGKNSVLFSLFQPSAGTARYFSIMEAALSGKGQRIRQILGIASAAAKAAGIAALLGAIPGLLLLALFVVLTITHSELRSDAVVVSTTVMGVIAGLVLAVIGAAIAVGIRLVLRGLKDLFGNNFGICKGFVSDGPIEPSGEDEDTERRNGRVVPKPLTTWLADEFDVLAGRPVDGAPLTLADLKKSGVNLKMFTTNLTEGSPYTLPFRTRDFYFDAETFREYFPERVVADMLRGSERAAEQLTDENKDKHAEILRLRPGLQLMPDAEDMPVVVMTRMSLSFPLLLSAVPLWRAYEEQGETTVRACWFSDGGITSNFPIHFFDSPLPRWPTFGINLGPVGPEGLQADEKKNIAAANTNDEGASRRWTGLDGFVQFVRAILDTMQNWMDNSQTEVPGYRDRIVVIKHSTEEGGMNLNMSADLIDRFARRGQLAGQLLVDRFAHPSSKEFAWGNHRWVRFRSGMRLIEDMHAKVYRGFVWPPEPAATNYGEMIDNPPLHPWHDDDMGTLVHGELAALLGVVTDWTGSTALPPPGSPLPAWLLQNEPVALAMSKAPTSEDFDPFRPFAWGAPAPRPTLRIVRDF
jgi:Patatin-like phospholipase